MTWTQVFRLFCNFLAHLSVVICLAVSRRTTSTNVGSMTALLESCERFIVVFCARISDLDLVNIWRSFFSDIVLLSCNFQWRCTIVSFKVVALFKTHFKVMLAIRLYSFLLLCSVEYILSRLFQTAFVFWHVVQFVTSQAKVGLDTSYPCKYLVSFLLSLLDCYFIRLG